MPSKLNWSFFFFLTFGIFICSFVVDVLYGAISTALPLIGVGCLEKGCSDSYINIFM